MRLNIWFKRVNSVIHGGSITPLYLFFQNKEFSISFIKEKSTVEMEKRRETMMARGIPKQKPIPGVKHIVLVSSGKGGVGKSTVSVNLALALSRLNTKPNVGILDADVFGPSIPLMMGLNDEPLLTKDNKMIPLINYGVKCMSMGFLVTEKSAVIWRGLMVMSAIERLLRQVHWGLLDYLIIDTPPGTGDTMLSILQNLPVSGAVIVTTPQKVALQVTQRGAMMMRKLSVPVIGIVQNMSTVKCPKCSERFSLFGDGARELSVQLGVPFLCDIPLEPEIANSADSGKPFIISSHHGQVEYYINLAKEVDKFLRQPSQGLRDSSAQETLFTEQDAAPTN